MTTAAIPETGLGERSRVSRGVWFPARTALFCVPMMLVPPMAMIGPYGITLAEALVVVGGAVIFFFQKRPLPAVPTPLIFYIGLYLIGWLGALYNSYFWHIPIGVGNVVVFYSIALSLFGYWIGRYSRYSLYRIVVHPVTKAFVLGVGLLALAYPFMSPAERQLVLAPFINQDFMARLAAPRFPGIGINGNTYSFMVFVVFLFAFDAFLRKRLSAIFPFAALLIILAGASRTVTGLAILSSIILVLHYVRRRPRVPLGSARPARPARPRSRRRAVFVGLGIILLAAAAVVYGAKVQEIFTLYARFEELLAGTEHAGLKGRQELWTSGVERIKLAPVLGIPKHPNVVDDFVPLYSYTPHNEFLYYWTVFGIAGMLAHVYLILYMLFRNLKERADPTWLLLYASMIVQMTFDAIFQGTRVVAFTFMLIGLNIKYLAELKQNRALKWT